MNNDYKCFYVEYCDNCPIKCKYSDKFKYGELGEPIFPSECKLVSANDIMDSKTKRYTPILKPCPFCGGTPYFESRRPGCFFVRCDACYAEGQVYLTLEEAARVWNDRVDM